jgi:hypothetical protein
MRLLHSVANTSVRFDDPTLVSCAGLVPVMRLAPHCDQRPSTLGSFLRGFTWGNVRQLEVVSRRLLADLATATPVLADAQVMAHLDIDSCQRRSTVTPSRARGSARAGGGRYPAAWRNRRPATHHI